MAHFAKSLGLGITIAVLIVVLAMGLVFGLLLWYEVLRDGFSFAGPSEANGGSLQTALWGLTWERFFIALFLLLVGMFVRAHWWRAKRVMRDWE